MNILVQFITVSNSIDKGFDKQFNIVSFHDVTEALEFLEQQYPNVIVLEYDLENNNTELLINTLLIESPNSKIILLGNNLSDEVIIQCLSQGVYGYLNFKDINVFLEKAIRSVAMGESWVSRKLVGLLIEKIRG